MARCPFATWDPIEGWPTRLFDRLVSGSRDPDRVIHHKTQGWSYPRDTYSRGGGIPHFTVTDRQTYQHYDTRRSSRALKNLIGGVETNRQGAIQVELVGFSGVTGTAVAQNMRRLMLWVDSTHGVEADFWPGGRPPQGGVLDHVGRGTWLAEGGQYAHSQVPENDHWDPAYTDIEWAIIYQPGPIFAPPDDMEEDEMWLVKDTDKDRWFLVNLARGTKVATSPHGADQYRSGDFDGESSPMSPLPTTRMSTDQLAALLG